MTYSFHVKLRFDGRAVTEVSADDASDASAGRMLCAVFSQFWPQRQPEDAGVSRASSSIGASTFGVAFESCLPPQHPDDC